MNALVRMGHEPATLLGALRQRLEAKEACVEGYATASPQVLCNPAEEGTAIPYNEQIAQPTLGRYPD